jgi:hypothetical protein
MPERPFNTLIARHEKNSPYEGVDDGIRRGVSAPEGNLSYREMKSSL